MTTVQAAIAASRFGLGPRPGDLAAIAPDPKGWLRLQLQQAPVMPQRLQTFPGSAELGNTVFESLKKSREANRNDRQQINRDMARMFRQQYRGEALARTMASIESGTPFYERLVHFWSNHFTVSASKNQAQPFLGAFEREVIRPHVLGRFEDMLLASTRHPAMLMYLDQAQSIGPNSMAGRFGGRGLNENLAREILELHTLGVDGGYSQDDVIAFAKMLTGWTLGAVKWLLPPRAAAQLPDLSGGDFLFADLLHEPGPKDFLGYRFEQQGEAQAHLALSMLARHPATARFIATKLARHFIADDPPERAVSILAQRFTQTGGDLKAMAHALIDLPEVWDAPLAKVRSPNDYVIAVARAIPIAVTENDVYRSLRDFGQQPFNAPSPAGWPDTGQAWLAPESLMRRVEAARNVAAALPASLDPDSFMAATIGPVANADTLLWVSRAPDRGEGVAMILAAPEFQRR